ncbi:MAG TPA: hypothetical protein VGW38_03895, partial [Chloroflexota bacterium]|nr:hypothetical protein [Chloroflexota bacterium]
MPRLRRRSALAAVLATATATLGCRPLVVRAPSSAPTAPGTDLENLPWQLLTEHILQGGPNDRLGLVQAQHIFGRVARADQFLRAGLFRVRVPANLIRLGDDGWRHERFPDGWWMEVARRMNVPFKAVLELWPRFTNEMHAAHAARVVHRVNPDVIIIGNELNVIDSRPGINEEVEIQRYLDQYGAMHAAVKAASPETKIQLYGEAYYGEPHGEQVFFRRVLTAMRQRGLPPPDIAGVHVYDHAEVIPRRVAGYRKLLAEFDLHIPISIEELGPRSGVIDLRSETRLTEQPATNPDQFPSRFAELRAAGWMTEAEQAELVAQHLATAAATADQAQVFCSIDFDAEIDTRRGLVSNVYGRARPAFGSFRFLQRLLNHTEDVHLTPAADNNGVNAVSLRRRDDITATIVWTPPMLEDGDPSGTPSGRPRQV